MSSNDGDDHRSKFLLAEYQDLYQNVMHVENSLFSHLSFFTTLFMGIVTASIAITQLSRGGGTGQSSAPFWLAVLFFLFGVVGRFELRMTTELRIRKMKFVEGITEIRRYFADKDPIVKEYLMLPVGLSKAPPYLRVRSADWYQVIYLSLMDGLSVVLGWIFLGMWLRGVIGTALGIPIMAILTAVWILAAGGAALSRLLGLVVPKYDELL